MEGKGFRRPIIPHASDHVNIGFTNAPAQSSNMPVRNKHPYSTAVTNQEQNWVEPVVHQPGLPTRTTENVESSITAHVQVPNFSYVSPVPVGPNGMRMRCYHCGADIKTTTTSVHKDTAHIACLMTASMTCCLCFWLPYCCCSAFQKVDHRCPCCDSYLGTYNG